MLSSAPPTRLYRGVTWLATCMAKADKTWTLHFIRNLFYDSTNENSYQLLDTIRLGKKLELHDLEIIILLKLQEKGLLTEHINDEIYYEIV